MGEWAEYYKEIDRYNLAYFHAYINGFGEYINKITQYAGRKKGLEIGTGTGLTSIYLAWLGYDITAIDNDKEIIEEAKKLSHYFRAKEKNPYFKGRLKFLCMDMFSLGFKDKQFDVVFHQGVLEHYERHQIKQALKEQLRVGERVVFSVPSNKYTQGKKFGDEHFWGFNEWERILLPFQIIDRFGFEYLDKPFEYRVLKYATLPIFILNKNFRKHILDSVFATNIGFVIR